MLEGKLEQIRYKEFADPGSPEGFRREGPWHLRTALPETTAGREGQYAIGYPIGKTRGRPKGPTYGKLVKIVKHDFDEPAFGFSYAEIVQVSDGAHGAPTSYTIKQVDGLKIISGSKVAPFTKCVVKESEGYRIVYAGMQTEHGNLVGADPKITLCQRKGHWFLKCAVPTLLTGDVQAVYASGKVVKCRVLTVNKNLATFEVLD